MAVDSVSKRRPEAITSFGVFSNRLEEFGDSVFSEDDDVSVRITDMFGLKTQSILYEDAEKLEIALKQDDPPSADGSRFARIISIHSMDTLDPLQITPELFELIMRKYNIDPRFLRILLSFGEDPQVAESSNNFFSFKSENDECCTMSYLINYVEENHRDGPPWSWRHTGVFHRHSESSDIYVVLHPMRDDQLEMCLLSRLENAATEGRSLDLLKSPFDFHGVVLSTFLDNWRWFFRDLGDQWRHENNKAQTADIERSDAMSSFARVQSLRNISDKTYRARACCNSNSTLIENFLQNSKTIIENDWLKSEQAVLKGYIESSDGFIERIRNTLDLVGYTLNLHNQLESAKIDLEIRDLNVNLNNVIEQLKGLTQHTVDDSSTVKIISLVSAIYLPGSFVGTLYGMNFFAFNMQTRRIVIGSDFWVFILTWIPLTLLTIGLYFLVVEFDKHRKGKPSLWPWKKAISGAKETGSHLASSSEKV